ncbi:GSCFA domain-containing protein [Methylobacterium sp. M6A4_1b]
MVRNPYADLPAERFWRKVVAGVPPFALAPGPSGHFTISSDARVATAGSCFAQHVARALTGAGFGHYLAEAAPAGITPEAAADRQYGTYSARYGNIYTARQLLQLFDRAYGTYTPSLPDWTRPDGRLVDPFRPGIEPAGFADAAEVEADRLRHLAAVRAMFESLDVLVFTLGLTEGWMHRPDGAMLPVAPGVVGGTFDPETYTFVNARTGDVRDDMLAFLERLFAVNPGARIILTVSPVPLIATYANRHVLVSNTYSKAALRAAAEEIVAAEPRAVYFPAYEIVTSTANAARYYDDDLRSVTPAAVDHVMRVFLDAFTDRAKPPILTQPLGIEYRRAASVICDEEAIERSLA